MKRHICDRCQGSYASPQSLWNHKQRCVGKAKPTFSAIPPKGEVNPVTSRRNISKTPVASAIDRIINDSPTSDMKCLSPLRPQKSSKLSDLSPYSTGMESTDGSESEQGESDESDNSEQGESDESDNIEHEEKAPLDDEAIKNLMKRFKTLHHQLIHKGRKEHVPILLEILNIFQDEGKLGDEHERCTKAVTKYQ